MTPDERTALLAQAETYAAARAPGSEYQAPSEGVYLVVTLAAELRAVVEENGKLRTALAGCKSLLGRCAPDKWGRAMRDLGSPFPIDGGALRAVQRRPRPVRATRARSAPMRAIAVSADGKAWWSSDLPWPTDAFVESRPDRLMGQDGRWGVYDLRGTCWGRPVYVERKEGAR
jgi:hypothetical protein